MEDMKDVKIYDGDDEIVFSNVLNVYDNSLKIKNIKGIDITFSFDEESSEKREKDIDIHGEGNAATVSFSSKIRNTLGSGTTSKTQLAEITIGSEKFKLLFSIYVSKMGEKSSGLNASITLYLRKI
jgi:hypothetical protein